MVKGAGFVSARGS